jgi:hypothetical protein
LLHGLLDGLGFGTFSCPNCTHGSYELGDWWTAVEQSASGGGSTVGLQFWWCLSSTKSWFLGWKPRV